MPLSAHTERLGGHHDQVWHQTHICGFRRKAAFERFAMHSIDAIFLHWREIFIYNMILFCISWFGGRLLKRSDYSSDHSGAGTAHKPIDVLMQRNALTRELLEKTVQLGEAIRHMTHGPMFAKQYGRKLCQTKSNQRFLGGSHVRPS